MGRKKGLIREAARGVQNTYVDSIWEGAQGWARLCAVQNCCNPFPLEVEGRVGKRVGKAK